MQIINVLSILIDFHSWIYSDFSKHKLFITECTDLCTWFLTICIDAATREHTLFVKTIFTSVLTTELTELDARVCFENGLTAGCASPSSYLLAIGSIQEKYRIFIAVVKLIVSDSDFFIMVIKAQQLVGELVELIFEIPFFFHALEFTYSVIARLLILLWSTTTTSLLQQSRAEPRLCHERWGSFAIADRSNTFIVWNKIGALRARNKTGAQRARANLILFRSPKFGVVVGVRAEGIGIITGTQLWRFDFFVTVW